MAAEGGRVEIEPGPPLYAVHMPEARHPPCPHQPLGAALVPRGDGAKARLGERRLANKPEGRVRHPGKYVEPADGEYTDTS